MPPVGITLEGVSKRFAHPVKGQVYSVREVSLEDWRARRPALTVYYLGVPDTTPEFASEDRLFAYLATASSERRLIR